jgi:predicted RNA polymerase sigma factor
MDIGAYELSSKYDEAKKEAIEAGLRAPLMPQLVVGLDAKMIASAFLTSPVAMGKRLVRAKYN